MKTQYYTATTLDGFIADDDHGIDWLYAAGEGGTDAYGPFIAEVGALAMGSGTYLWVTNHLAAERAAGREAAWPYAQPTWVFSSRDDLPQEHGADLRFVRGDVRPVHAEMVDVANGKNVWLVGGGDLVGQFHDAGLLDEILVHVAPATLGSGKPLLPRRIIAPQLRLVSAQQDGAFAQLVYAVERSSSIASP